MQAVQDSNQTKPNSLSLLHGFSAGCSNHRKHLETLGSKFLGKRESLASYCQPNSSHSAQQLIINQNQGACITSWVWSYSCSLEVFACLRMAGAGSSNIKYEQVKDARQDWVYMCLMLDSIDPPATGKTPAKRAWSEDWIQINTGAHICWYKYMNTCAMWQLLKGLMNSWDRLHRLRYKRKLFFPSASIHGVGEEWQREGRRSSNTLALVFLLLLFLTCTILFLISLPLFDTWLWAFKAGTVPQPAVCRAQHNAASFFAFRRCPEAPCLIN